MVPRKEVWSWAQTAAVMRGRIWAWMESRSASTAAPSTPSSPSVPLSHFPRATYQPVSPALWRWILRFRRLLWQLSMSRSSIWLL